MKELTIEQKAKRYDEAKARMSIAYNSNRCTIGFMNEIFPELKESEDERIRKELLNYLYDIHDDDEERARWIAWLEKQSEQKSNDKIEFKIGDLITNGILVGKIDEIHEWGYHAYFGDHYADVPDAENWHKWTIQDAKDGDVLSYRNGQWIFIYKEKIDDSSFYYHALYSTIQGLTITNVGFTLLNDAITPATKEQRDTLMKVIDDAGYTFDFENKKLLKVF